MVQRIYVLKLEDGKFYIGSTKKSVDERFIEHCTGRGSAWTRMFEPLQILEEHVAQTKFDEDNKVLEMMEQYGIENVRGGSHSQVELQKEEVEQIEKRLRHADNRCLGCGSYGHFIADCPQKPASRKDPRSDSQSRTVVQNPYSKPLKRTQNTGAAQATPSPPKRQKFSSVVGCSRCGRDNHTFENCYATTHADGTILQTDSNVSRLGYSPEERTERVCSRCGRTSHNSNNCFASTDVH